jgi:hypothetical protein
LILEGDIFYFKGDLIHRDDGPAIELKTGHLWWVRNGLLHREDGPAIIEGNNKEYWLNGRKATTEEIKNIKRNYWMKRMTYGNK